MNIIKTRLIRLLALSTLVGLTVLSLQSLGLRYIELPAMMQAAKNAVKIVSDKGNAVILKQNGELKKLHQGVLDQAIEIGADQETIANLQMELMTSRGNESGLSAIVQNQGKAIKELNDGGDRLLKIIATEYMPKDQCVAVKKPDCANKQLNGHDEACGI